MSSHTISTGTRQDNSPTSTTTSYCQARPEISGWMPSRRGTVMISPLTQKRQGPVTSSRSWPTSSERYDYQPGFSLSLSLSPSINTYICRDVYRICTRTQTLVSPQGKEQGSPASAHHLIQLIMILLSSDRDNKPYIYETEQGP